MPAGQGGPVFPGIPVQEPLQVFIPGMQHNPLTGLNFQGTGKLSTPMGAKLLRTSAMESGKLIGLDSRFALEMVQGSDVIVEYDKLIDRQLERAAITSISGFAKLFTRCV